ncbi:helix-turn-helix domain-containing protein [Mucilaginibacter flavus]|uniref:helix-turn-helix domain-containing protein n=1 Tax=Mucilaginibacter flavus TaxID=931504 RepID=UPI0025B5D3F7|nr:helix-turn-helix domain-containing protein [Mucilaginibacter flavus]MDN3584608.1 helix-turn-helix domain-containing protein [Mucilaginibacter flavus]
MAAIPVKYLNRQQEITDHFLYQMNKHMDEFMAGYVEEMLSLKDIASIMCLHPVHISNVIKLHTGFHPCHFYELRILNEAKKLLADYSLTITDVARRLTYDNSNFTKYFKEYAGMTPTAYRKIVSEQAQADLPAPNTKLYLVA